MNRSTFFLAALALTFTAESASSQGLAHRGLAHPEPVPALALVSRSSAGVQSNSWSGAASLSESGRFIAFHSISDNLVVGDTNSHWDVFVHDRFGGVTERVSVDSSGIQANGSSNYPSISADGSRVAFASYATNLVPGDAGSHWDVFVHDRASGETRLVSRSSAGVQGNFESEYPALSADGRFVAFQSWASNLAPDPNGSVRDVFVHELASGETTLVSFGHQGQAADEACERPAISGDGRRVAFQSGATNLVPDDTNAAMDVFVRDAVAGTTVRASVDSAGVQASNYSLLPALSRDGRFVAFQSLAVLVPGDDDGGFADVYLHDLATGETLGITAVDPAFAVNTSITQPSISGDGSAVAFQAAVVNYPFVETSHVFLHDRARGATTALSRRFGAPGDGDSTDPAISADGRGVGFESRAANLVSGDTNGAADVFVHTGGGR